MRGEAGTMPPLEEGVGCAFDLEEILREVLGVFVLRHDRNHGVGHWARVMANGRELARRLNLSSQIVELFALLHDCRREVEGVDREHGARAADYVHALAARGLIRLGREDLDVLAFACRHHSSGRRDGPLMAQICWDADRLDLGRVGISPAVERLCTDHAREAAFFGPAVAAGWARIVPELVDLEWRLTWRGSIAMVAPREPQRSPLIFHGTLVESGGAATRRVFRFRRHEPTLTYDLATACLIYAAPDHHPNRERHAGALEGACLALRAPGWRFEPPPTATLWLEPDALEIRGGVTKWIGGYLAPYREDELAGRDSHRRSFVAGRLRTDSAWKAERGQYRELDTGAGIGPVTPALRTWLETVDTDLRGGGPAGAATDTSCAALADVDGVALLAACFEARACRWLRRALLSALRARGIRIMAVDVDPPIEIGEPVLWPRLELERRLAGLAVSLGRRPTADRLRAALAHCRAVLTTDRLLPPDAARALAMVGSLTEPRLML